MDGDDWDPAAWPGHYISRISRGLARVGDVRLREIGFATAQLPVLAALKDGGQLSQTELMRWAKVEQPTMTQLLARMERDGIVRREPDPLDRRSMLVSLTGEARAKLPAGRAILKQANAEMTKGLSDVEVETLVRLLGRVLANVETMGSKADSPATARAVGASGAARRRRPA
jgi:DNA-binding MarR family transcriptional regulator